MLSVQPKFVNCMLLLPGNTSCVTFSLQFRSSSPPLIFFCPFLQISQSLSTIWGLSTLDSLHYLYNFLHFAERSSHFYMIFSQSFSIMPPLILSPFSTIHFYPTEIKGGHSTWNVGLSQTLLQHSIANYLESFFFFSQEKTYETRLKEKEKILK